MIIFTVNVDDLDASDGSATADRADLQSCRDKEGQRIP